MPDLTEPIWPNLRPPGFIILTKLCCVVAVVRRGISNKEVMHDFDVGSQLSLFLAHQNELKCPMAQQTSVSPSIELDREQNLSSIKSANELLQLSHNNSELSHQSDITRKEEAIKTSSLESKRFGTSLDRPPSQNSNSSENSSLCPPNDGFSSKDTDTIGANSESRSEVSNLSSFSEPRKKKTRTVFSRSQIFQLESTFDMKRYLSSSERANLAASLHLTETQV